MLLIIVVEFQFSQASSPQSECLLLTWSYHAEWDDKEEGNEAIQQWEDDWDDDDVNDDFSLHLRKELEGANAQKS